MYQSTDIEKNDYINNQAEKQSKLFLIPFIYCVVTGAIFVITSLLPIFQAADGSTAKQNLVITAIKYVVSGFSILESDFKFFLFYLVTCSFIIVFAVYSVIFIIKYVIFLTAIKKEKYLSCFRIIKSFLTVIKLFFICSLIFVCFLFMFAHGENVQAYFMLLLPSTIAFPSTYFTALVSLSLIGLIMSAVFHLINPLFRPNLNNVIDNLAKFVLSSIILILVFKTPIFSFVSKKKTYDFSVLAESEGFLLNENGFLSLTAKFFFEYLENVFALLGDQEPTTIIFIILFIMPFPLIAASASFIRSLKNFALPLNDISYDILINKYTYTFESFNKKKNYYTGKSIPVLQIVAGSVLLFVNYALPYILKELDLWKKAYPSFSFASSAAFAFLISGILLLILNKLIENKTIDKIAEKIKNRKKTDPQPPVSEE